VFEIGIVVYQGVDLLDLAAPYEFFQWLALRPLAAQPIRVRLIAESNKPITTRDGLTLQPQAIFADVPALDLLWVAGGDPAALQREKQNPKFLDYLRTSSRDATYIASVCEGALLLAEAGLLDGFKATTHWQFLACLKAYPKIEIAAGHPRFVVDDRAGKKGIRVTGGGISSGLDEALEIIRHFAGKQTAEGVQLVTQYYPDPPVMGTIPPVGNCPL